MPKARRRGLKTRYQMAVEREYGRPWQDVLSHMLYVRRRRPHARGGEPTEQVRRLSRRKSSPRAWG